MWYMNTNSIENKTPVQETRNWGPGTPHANFQKIWHMLLKQYDRKYYDENYSGLSPEGYLIDKEGNTTNTLASHISLGGIEWGGELQNGQNVAIHKFKEAYPGVDVPPF